MQVTLATQLRTQLQGATMSNTAAHRFGAPSAVSYSRPITLAVLAAWLALVAVLGARGTFAAPPGVPPIALMTGVALPLVSYGVGYVLWKPFRDFVLGADLHLITALQAWRFLGFGFIALHVHGILPGLFAWPAGLGDMAIAAAAPWVVQALARRPEFATSKTFLAWNSLGIADLCIAVLAGILGLGLVPGVVQDITTAPMALLPLVLVPAYLVPIMTMLHISSLLQARAATRR
jgi:hypothetical protein